MIVIEQMSDEVISKNFQVNSPTVSIWMITYGHEKYIEQAIYSVLMQECNFEFELIISNDCSPDKTDDIIQSIIQNHPKANCIKYFNHKKNLGMNSNSIFALEQCKADYVAACEGDDFWTDKLKLQKQVDFLKNNPDCSLCFHNANIYYEESGQNKLFKENYNKNFYTAEDILQNWLIPTASMLFINVFKKDKLPDFFNKAMHCDLMIQLFLYEYGNYGFINETMCTYRINKNSATQSLFYTIPYKHACIYQFKSMKIYFKRKYDKYFNQNIIDQNRSLIKVYKTNHFLKQFESLFNMITLEPLAIIKFNQEIYASFKIIFHNVLSKINIK